jgi:hypothetical protein
VLAADEALAALRAKRAGRAEQGVTAPYSTWAEDVEGDPHEVANPMFELLRMIFSRLEGGGPAGGVEGAPVSGDAPLMTWRQVATALDVDDSTLRSLRKRAGDHTVACFANVEEAQDWYRSVKSKKAKRLGVTAEPRTKARRRREEPRVTDGVVDWGKVQV